MLRNLSALQGMSMRALDGEIGAVVDAYFDDHTWTLRYLVADAAAWLSGRNVLISPFAVRAVAWRTRHMDLGLTRRRVRESPDIGTVAPVSRQREIDYFDYYGYPYYWAGRFRWGPAPMPFEFMEKSEIASGVDADAHLRSARAVVGHYIEAADGAIGHVEDLLYDEDDWSLRFLVIDMRLYVPGRHVVVPVSRVERVSWDDRTVELDLDQAAVREAPEFGQAPSGFMRT